MVADCDLILLWIIDRWNGYNGEVKDANSCTIYYNSVVGGSGCVGVEIGFSINVWCINHGILVMMVINELFQSRSWKGLNHKLWCEVAVWNTTNNLLELITPHSIPLVLCVCFIVEVRYSLYIELFDFFFHVHQTELSINAIY